MGIIVSATADDGQAVTSSSHYEPEGTTNKEMHYGMQKPEINSGFMYAGPGADSMVAAARKWSDLIPEVLSLVGSFKQVRDGLQEPWSGPSAIRMAEAAAPFQQWLVTLIWQIGRTSHLTFILAEAYYLALDTMVEPHLIEDNRDQMQKLLADNNFEQNAAEIAGLEAQYAQYRADDIAVMQRYDWAVSEALSAMTPWGQPQPITDEAGLARQADAV